MSHGISLSLTLFQFTKMHQKQRAAQQKNLPPANFRPRPPQLDPPDSKTQLRPCLDSSQCRHSATRTIMVAIWMCGACFAVTSSRVIEISVNVPHLQIDLCLIK